MGQIRRDLPNDEYQAAIGANNPSASNPFATISDVTSSDLPHAVASGTNTYTVTIPGVTAYTDGDAYLIRFTNGSDADSTININSLGAKDLTKKANVQVTGGDIVAGQEIIIVYDGTNFQCIQTTANQLFAYVTNDDSVTITAGQPVYAFGAAGNRMSVKLANNTADATSAQTVGLVFSSSIAPNQRGFVITQGVIDGLNTGMYSAGDQLYLGATAGALTNVKPYAPNHLVYIGIVERANVGNGQIYVKPQNGYELDELHDVDLITSPPLDGQVLTYESATQLWKAKPVVSEDEAPLVFVMAATDGALVNTPVYYNGPANDGIGATLTSVGNVVLSDNSAVGRIDTNYIPEAGDLILVKNQADQRQNGIYEITQVGSTVAPLAPYILTRSIEADEPFELYPLQINVFQGLVNGSKYFTQTNTLWGDAVPPVIGGTAPAANIIFDLTSLTTTPLQITFVDHVTVAALPACTYTLGTDVTKPGVGATLTGVSTGILVLSGMTASASTISATGFTTLLVKNQAEPRHNGTYQVINPGSATTRWILRRIDNLAAGFNKSLRIVFCTHNASLFVGKYFTPVWNPTLLNKNIGVTAAVSLATNRIDYLEFTPQRGPFGIANSLGVYVYYPTFSTAMAAALSGQTIEMFADVTETACTPIQLKNGVNINLNGHTYTQANNVCVVNAIQDGGAAVNCSISNGTLVRTLGQGAALGITGASVIRGDKLNLIGTVLGVYGSLTINNTNAAVYNMFCRSAGSATLVTAGSLYDTISIGLNGVGLANSGLISNCTGIGTGAQSILNNAGGRAIKCIGYNGTVSIQNLGIAIDCTAISNIGGAFTAQPNSTSINCTAYSSASVAFVCNGNSLIQGCKGISTAGVGISMINGKIEGCMAYSATSNAISTTNSGAIPSEIINCHAVSIAAVTIVVGNTVPGSTIHKTYIECLWPITFGHAINVSNAGANLEVIQCFIRTIDSTTNAIFSSVLKTVKYSQNAYRGMTVPINAFVVQGITNTQDNQGNILI